jgi:ribonuclease HI
MQIASDAAEYTVEFNCANRIVDVVTPVSSVVENWCPPSIGMLKLNVDAGCFADGFISFGMVIRDSSGLVQFASTKREKRQASPSLAEAMALRWCLQWILSSNQDGQFIVETDAEVVVKCLQGCTRLSDIENIVLDCNDILSSLSNCNVVFIRRCKNTVAHSLVKFAKQFGSSSWVGYVPEPVL